jgi:hypothetical protein
MPAPTETRCSRNSFGSGHTGRAGARRWEIERKLIFTNQTTSFSRGGKVGHADKESRIRRRDGLIFKGEEIGYVDRQKNIRRPDGVIFQGDVVGKVKGTAAHAQDGLIFEGEQWGYVDDDGNIRQPGGGPILSIRFKPAAHPPPARSTAIAVLA